MIRRDELKYLFQKFIMYHLKTILILFLAAHVSYSYTMEPCKNIDTELEKCITLLSQLNDQPLFTGYGSMIKECKVLPLKNWDNCLMISILCENAKTKLGRQKAWHVHDFGCGNNRRYDSKGKDLGDGITEWLYKDNIPARCSLQELKLVFYEIVQQLCIGWNQSTLAEHPDIFLTQPEDEWYLFIKPTVLHQEADLLSLFASAFDIHIGKDISCHYHWKKSSGDFELRDTLYLWIKKESYDKVIKALNLQI
jgi:hypothetical protein